jgi:hypothetical protein
VRVVFELLLLQGRPENVRHNGGPSFDLRQGWNEYCE